jgi:cyclophilin family peptidyl-prolyl cis-trans isomerase
MWIFFLAAVLAGSAAVKPTAPTRVLIDTSKGKIVVELYADKAPATVKNFLTYVNEGFYDGTIFHRVIPGFMVQGGGMKPDMSEKAKSHPTVKNEADNKLSNSRGTLAMARTSDPHSASSQFFINLKDNTFLDRAQSQDGWGYTVFGKVVEGMDVVDAIAGVPTGSKGGHQNVPREAVTLKTAKVAKE